jgi:hypothetical protein
MKKISKLQHKLQGPNIPASLKVQAPEVSGNSPEDPENCCRNSTSGKFFGGSRIYEFRPIELLESG